MLSYKVLLISPVPPPAGGDSTWSYKYLQYCRQVGYDACHVNTSITGKRALTVSERVNIFFEMNRCIRIWRDIRTKIKREVPHIAHMNTNCSPRGLIRDYISGWILRRRHTPFVIHCRCNVQDQIGHSHFAIRMFTRLAKIARIVIVQNALSMNYVRTICGGDVRIAPNFIEPSYIAEHKAIADTVSMALFVGHVRKSKGIEELLAAAHAFPQIQFTIAGPVTEDYTQDEILKRSIGNVHLTGAVSADEVRALLDEADVLVFPTYTEGFSNALLEAMARGLPVITTDVGANRDMIESSGGILIKTGSAEAVREALQTIESPETRARMSQWNLEKVTEHYSIDAVMPLLRAWYEEVICESAV